MILLDYPGGIWGKVIQEYRAEMCGSARCNGAGRNTPTEYMTRNPKQESSSDKREAGTGTLPTPKVMTMA
jgi:hypothetical protein